MFLFNSRERGRPSFCRRWINAVLLIAYTTTAAGVPLPSGPRPQSSQERYPCSTSVCGCDSAERCWRSCCCHTLAERMAWAREHGVQPPAFAIAEARLAGLDVSRLAHTETGPGSSPRRCCVSKSQDVSHSCCQRSVAKESAQATRACCADSADKGTDTSSTAVLVWQALKCRGQSPNWIVAVPPPIHTLSDVALGCPTVEWLGPNLSERANSTADAPADPPPEAA
jgi:hypothetical protein